MEPSPATRRHPPILDEYERRRGDVDQALVKDAERVFEALLASMTPEEIEERVALSRFRRPEEYRETIRLLCEIARERMGS